MSNHSNPILLLLVGAIHFYQRTISPDHGPGRWLFPAGVCRFRPTCSEYMAQAITDQGWRGVVLGLKRLSHCHPYATSL